MTRGFARILVPTDFSPPSGAALATAGALAAQFGASIHLIHVLDDPYTAAAYASDVYGYAFRTERILAQGSADPAGETAGCS